VQQSRSLANVSKLQTFSSGDGAQGVGKDSTSWFLYCKTTTVPENKFGCVGGMPGEDFNSELRGSFEWLTVSKTLSANYLDPSHFYNESFAVKQ
jgi:hypothetical protein